MKSTLFYTIVLAIVLYSANLHAAIVKGYVFDSKTKEPLIGSVIFIKETKESASAGLDGSYSLRVSNSGNYTIVCQYIGYNTQESAIAISNNNEVLKLDFDLAPTVNELTEVQVTGLSDSESDVHARKTEQNADQVMNVLSAKTMQLLPDITIANVLQRISGVTVERSNTGDGRYAIIRGMDQRYNYTLVNGIKIPSPDNKYRFVPMDMFPSELIERLELIKALTPNMEGDATGGVMNMVTKNAPEKFYVNANAGTGYSQILADKGYTNFDAKTVNPKSLSQIHGNDFVATPSDFNYKNFEYTSSKGVPFNSLFGLTIGNRFLKEKKLGIIFSASYQNLFRGATSLFFKPNSQAGPGNVPYFDDQLIRQISTNQTRYGFHTKIDYRFNKSNSISLYGMFIELDETQYRHTVDTSLSIGRGGPGTGNTYILDRSRIQTQNITNSTLQGNHEIISGLKLDWTVAYSIANNNVPDWSELETVHRVSQNYIEPTNINSFKRIWTRNSDQDISEYLNLKYNFKFLEQDFELAVGAMDRNKTRDNFYNEYNLTPKTGSDGYPIKYPGLQIPYNGTSLDPNLFVFSSSDAAQGSPINPNTYSVTENIFGYYFQAKADLWRRLEILGGFRFENTYQSFKNVMPNTFAQGNAGTIKYSDIMPSIHFKYKINTKQNLRLSYFNSIMRPGFFEITPYLVSSGDVFIEQGNPFIKHATAYNYDIRYEWFPKGLDQVLIGIFYKRIENPIEIALLPSGTSSTVVQPNNYGTATNYGFELSLTKYFGVFGLSGNYTFTQSAITTTKKTYDENHVFGTQDQTRPLQGQSPHIANVSLLYKNSKLGLDLQLAAVYTGQKIALLSNYYNLDYWQKEMVTLDFSFEKTFLKYFSIYGKAQNLLNTPYILEIHHQNIYKTGSLVLTDQTSDNSIIVQKDYYGQNFIIGLRFKL